MLADEKGSFSTQNTEKGSIVVHIKEKSDSKGTALNVLCN